MVAAAIIGGAVVGAAGTAVAGSQAAGATRDATNASIAQQQSALQQQATLSQPYRDLGQSAIPTLQGLLGIGGADPTQTLRNTPGYQFQLQQGTQNTVNQATAMGLGLSGNTLEGLSKFNQGLADTTYQQVFGNAESVVGMGQAAAAGQAQNVGNSASNISNALINQGNTLAGIDANTTAGIVKSIGNAGNQFIENQTLAGLNPGSIDTSMTPGLYTPAGGGGYTYNIPGGP